MSQWNHKSEMLWVNSSIRLQIPVAGHRTSGREGSGLEIRPEGGLRGGFLNFHLTDLPSKLRTDIVLADRDTHELFTDKMRYIFLELPSFKKEESECETDFERWIYVLKNMETLQRLPFKARNAVFKKLEEIVDIASMSKEDRMRYDESIKVYRDQLAVMEFERNKGLAEGRAEGRAEEKESVARNLKRMGMDVETIVKATGLDPDVIESL